MYLWNYLLCVSFSRQGCVFSHTIINNTIKMNNCLSGDFFCRTARLSIPFIRFEKTNTHTHTVADREKTPVFPEEQFLWQMPATLCITLSSAFSQLRIIISWKCVIFHPGFTPCHPYYWLPLPLKTDKISMHIYSQLERSFSSPLFKSNVHND